jgi:GPH family glycoside/pentoside/hexuronide:cation symporter
MEQIQLLPTETRSLPPVRVDIAFSLIMLGTTIAWSVNDGWLLYFYLPPEGQGVTLVPLAFYGIVVMIARIVNAAVTPPIGYWSDNLRSKWGRRLPFMFTASLPLAIAFFLLWIPPVQGESMANLIYLGVILVFFNIAQNLVIIPLGSLLPELAETDRHRVRLTAWSASFQLIGVILAGAAGLIIGRFGFVSMALIFAVIILPFLYLPFFVLREKPGRQIDTAQRMGFLQSIRTTITNRAFLMLTATGVCFWTATTFLMQSIPFIVTEICQQDISSTTYFYLVAVLPLLACYPLVNWLSTRYGKWKVFSGSLLASAIVLPGIMLIGPWLPVPLLAQGLIWIALQAIAMSGVTMLPQAFAAEITDYDETITGQRREGAYYSAWSLLGQVISGVAALVLSLLFLLGRSQADVNGPLGVRLTGLIGGVLMFAAFLLFFKYPLRHLSRPVTDG